jgi:hypothetical protein
VKPRTLFVATNGACATCSAPPCCRNLFHKQCVLASENFYHTTHNLFLPPPTATTMAAMGGVYVPECASCHKPGNMACKGCLLVTVSHSFCLFRSLVTDISTVLQQILSNKTLEHPQARLQLSAQTAALDTTMGAGTSPACFRRRHRATTGVARHQKVPLGQHA